VSDFIQWVTHGVKRGRFEMGRRTALYLLAIVMALTVTAALYLMLVSRTAARGRHIQQLQAELFRLQRENQQLEVEIAKESAITNIWSRAIELGFIPAEQVEYLALADDG
jgi:cell division protein FtsB